MPNLLQLILEGLCLLILLGVFSWLCGEDTLQHPLLGLRQFSVILPWAQMKLFVRCEDVVVEFFLLLLDFILIVLLLSRLRQRIALFQSASR